MIHDKINGILSLLGVPYYARMPTFASGKEPELYIVYTLYNRVKSRLDGRIEAIEYTVTVNVIGRNTAAVDDKKTDIISLFEENGIHFAGCNYMSDSDFPQRFRRIMDFYTYETWTSPSACG